MVREQALKPDFSDVRGRRLLIALSGGADSVALAVMLAEARTEYDLTLFAAHIDHGIRSESAEDADFCRKLCEKLDIPFLTTRIDVPAEALKTGRGLETVARNRRYERLRDFRRRTQSDYIALAHHMDDQAETVLMHLFRGAGVEGLCGMRVIDETTALYRPLLGFRKVELIDYLIQRGLGWREDATNRVADNPRNALRLNVIPELERWYPQLTRAVARCANTVQAESDLIRRLTRDYLKANSYFGPMCAWIGIDPVPDTAVLRRAILAICPEILTFEQVSALEALCAKARGKLDLGSACFAERTGQRLYFVPKHPPSIQPVPVNLNGETRLGPLGVLTAKTSPPIPVRDDPARQVLKLSALRDAELRTRQPGDRIRPLGGGDKLLSDYFIDKKVDRPLRDAVALVAVGNRVHWVYGYGISQEAAVQPDDEAVELEYHDFLQRRNENAQ